MVDHEFLEAVRIGNAAVEGSMTVVLWVGVEVYADDDGVGVGLTNFGTGTHIAGL